MASLVRVLFSSCDALLICFSIKSVIVDREFFKVCIWLSKACLSLILLFLGSVTLLLQTPKTGELEAEFEREFIIEGNGVE